MGAALLVFATAVGIFFVHRPGENALDRFAFGELAPASSPPTGVLHLLLLAGTRDVAVGAVVVASAFVLLHDWRRAIALLAGSALAIVITQIVAKPLVGGAVRGFGGHSYPSGTVTAVAAYVAALSFAAPRRWRFEVALVGAAVIAAVSGAVIAARWHFATDALGGSLVGVGSVVTFDGLMHLRTRRAPVEVEESVSIGARR